MIRDLLLQRYRIQALLYLQKLYVSLIIKGSKRRRNALFLVWKHTSNKCFHFRIHDLLHSYITLGIMIDLFWNAFCIPWAEFVPIRPILFSHPEAILFQVGKFVYKR